MRLIEVLDRLSNSAQDQVVSISYFDGDDAYIVKFEVIVEDELYKGSVWLFDSGETSLWVEGVNHVDGFGYGYPDEVLEIYWDIKESWNDQV